MKCTMGIAVHCGLNRIQKTWRDLDIHVHQDELTEYTQVNMKKVLCLVKLHSIQYEVIGLALLECLGKEVANGSKQHLSPKDTEDSEFEGRDIPWNLFL